MIPLEKGFHHFRALLQFMGSVLLPAQAFLPQRAIEAFDVGLLILAVRPGYSVAIAEQRRIGQEIGLEFRTAISLDEMHVSPESSPHALVQEPGTVICRQVRSQENVRLSGEDIYGCEGVDISEVHGIHLYDLSGDRGYWYGSSLSVLSPSGADNVLLGQDFIDLRNRQMNAVLQLEKVLDLLPATVELPFSELPHQPLHYEIDLPASSLTFLGLLVLVQESQQAILLDALDPKVDRLAMFT